MKFNTLVKLLALLMTMVLCITSLAGCNNEKDPADTESFSMGDFTIVGNNESEKEDGNINTDSSETTSNGGISSSNVSSSGKTETPNTDSGKTTSLSAAEVLAKMPKTKVKELKVCCWEDYRNTAYGKALEEFEKKTGIKVKAQIITKDSYDTEVAGLIASGQSPDLVLMIRTTTSSIKNLQPISVSGYNFNDTAWDKNVMEDFTFNGKTYAMAVKNSPKQNVCVIYYNKKALKKAEMEDPYQIWKKNPKDWTWNKLWSMCETFVNKNKNKEGYYGITFSIQDLYIRSFGTGLLGFNPKTSKFESYITSSESIKRYTTLMDKIDKGLASSTADGGFGMGYILFNMSYSSMLEKAQNLSSDIAAVPVPTDSTTVPGFEYCAFGIPIGAKNAEAAPYFVRWVFGPDLYNLSDFYRDEQSKIVVEDMLSRGDMCMTEGWRWNVWNALTQGSSSQVKTVLESYKGVIEDEVAIENAAIAEFKK